MYFNQLEFELYGKNKWPLVASIFYLSVLILFSYRLLFLNWMSLRWIPLCLKRILEEKIIEKMWHSWILVLIISSISKWKWGGNFSSFEGAKRGAPQKIRFFVLPKVANWPYFQIKKKIIMCKSIPIVLILVRFLLVLVWTRSG